MWRAPIFLSWMIRTDVHLRYLVFRRTGRWMDWLIQRDRISMAFYIRHRFNDPRALLRVRQAMALHWWILLQIRHPLLRRGWTTTKEA